MKAPGIGAKVTHPVFGEGVVFGENDHTFRLYFREHGEKELGKEYEGYTVLEGAASGTTPVALEDIVAAVQNVFDQYYEVTDIIELGDKWEKGNLILQPADPSLKSKEVPIETFFHKIVMLRDRLRVMEQKINANDKLTESEKIEMQQYITRIYGTLTTFNVLFRSKKDYFVGESKDNREE
ncbi:MAG: hypothetical protein RL220_2065 [Bacteroidota bacterium]